MVEYENNEHGLGDTMYPVTKTEGAKQPRMYRLPLADIICTEQWGLITSRLQTPKEQEPVHITFVYCDIMSLTNSITIRVQAITRSQLRNYLAPAFSSLFPVFPRYDKKSDVDDSQYPECS